MPKFQTRARAVDMLGRQQIAGIPTAISELFKNAHDAYAEHVEVDFYREDRLFILRDDGQGMTREEFEQRWLTLGTESKAEGKIKPPAGHSPRPSLGEKGIGRLAIAAIGPQVLVLTRAASQPNLVAAYVNWRIFEAPGINVEDINIPVLELQLGSMVARAEVRKLLDDFRSNLDILARHSHSSLRKRIEKDLGVFQEVDPSSEEKFFKGPKSLELGQGKSGTHFYIKPTNETLLDEIDGDPDEKEASPLTTTLIGFTDSMTPGHNPPLIKTAFRDHKGPDNVVDIIGEQEFFRPDEFENADHQFIGEFDEHGCFKGTVVVYGEEHQHVVTWPKGVSRPTRCGPFKLHLAYIMGRSNESTLPAQQYADMIQKLNKVGGLYIYRDGVRVLPYGNKDADFLDIEARRSKSAQYYFFSYRRMFGAILLTRQNNSDLREKAGREGFIQNKAYRQFRDVLMNFFTQIAADFFRKDASHERFLDRKAELQQEAKARDERKKKVKVEQKKLETQLEELFEKLETEGYAVELERISQEALARVEQAGEVSNKDKATDLVYQAEVWAHNKLTELRRSLQVSPPTDVGLPPRLQEALEAYLIDLGQVEESVFKPFWEKLRVEIQREAQRVQVEVDRNESVRRLLQSIVKDVESNVKKAVDQTVTADRELHGSVARVVEEAQALLQETVDEVRDKLKEVQIPTTQPENFSRIQLRLEERVRDVAQAQIHKLDLLRLQLGMVTLANSDEKFSLPETIAALETELYGLEDQTLADLELAQLGTAIAIISHEFANSIKTVRLGIRRLRAWVKENPELQGVYDEIRTAFDNLDEYLKLFTPLQRRLYRKKVVFSGRSLAEYVRRLFGERFEKDQIDLEVSPAFARYEIEGYPSSFYPAIVNLVDNAAYWLKDRPRPRTIVLDAKGDALLVQDNGPGIAKRDFERIFEPGFSRKTSGRGMGLKIARDALQQEDYVLYADPEAERGACFVIEPMDELDLGN